MHATKIQVPIRPAAGVMVATPVGWVGLVIGGIAVAGVAAGASIWTNNKVKNNSGSLYDDIMMWINSP